MSAPSAVESLFSRLQISEFYHKFKEEGIDKIVSLRRLTETQLRDLLPDDRAFNLLREALNKNAEPPTAAAAQPKYADAAADDGARGRGGRGAGGRGGAAAGGEEGARRPRPKRVCRDFFDHGCSYGDDCRFSHDPEQHRLEGAPAATSPKGEQYEEEISVPWDSVKLLLGNKAERLNRINYRCGTTNSRIDRPEAFHQTYAFLLKGPKEGVKRAKAEIEQFVGITSAKNREARFNYAKNELERNTAAVEYLAAANALHKGTGSVYELSEETLKKVCDTFKFQVEPKITQFWTLSTAGTDKDKFETLMPLVKSFKGIQAIIFTEPKRVPEMQKRSKQTAEALGVKNPQFVHRDMTKEERMKALEAFKEGEVNENGVVQRVLVTNNDYAKYARKVLIPYVNLILHFSMPKTKELYLHQSMCTGRSNHQGVSLLFITHNDSAMQKEWCASLPLNELGISEWEAAVKTVDYDTATAPLTSKAADPDPNWRENLLKEAEEKARIKAAKAAEKAKP